MRIQSITVENFRCFKRLEVNLRDSAESSVAALVAPNGHGKTAVLEAIKYLLGSFIARFKGIRSPGVRESDFRQEWELKQLHIGGGGAYRELKPSLRAPYMRLSAEMECEGDVVSWDIVRVRDKSERTKDQVPAKIGLAGINQLADRYIDAENNDAPITLPVIAYYNTERAVVRKRPERMRAFRTQFNRSDAYAGALDGGLDYKGLIEWVCFIEDEQRREREARRDFDYFSVAERTIQKAIGSLLPGFSNLHVTRRPLDLAIDYDNFGEMKSCLVDEQLSDGYRIVLALALNLVSRILEANGSLPGVSPDELLRTPGIVLIDEVDLHLHPTWQQRIVEDLRRTFPCIQFIVTTHSPQVVSSLKSSSVYVMKDFAVTSFKETMQTRGLDANQLLADVFGSSFAAHSEERRELENYAKELENGTMTHEEREVKFNKLKDYFGESDPAIEMIRFRKELLDDGE